jgi:uncharacterized protein
MKRYQSISELPAVLSVFPLSGALLLPRAELPLNIFEDRYLKMFEQAVSTDRLIGMIQPEPGDGSDTPALAKIGCAGRVTSYTETDDNRLLVSLTGVCRFEVVAEQKLATPFRQCSVRYDGFAADLVTENQGRSVNREALITAFRQFLEANNMSANWDEVDKVPTENLVNTLSQLAPYPAAEKQALLEAPDLKSRADMLIALTEVALSKQAYGESRTLQ